jgi:hypothetical protein
MLILMSQPANERAGTSDRVFMAFKLHRFLSGAVIPMPPCLQRRSAG